MNSELMGASAGFVSETVMNEADILLMKIIFKMVFNLNGYGQSPS